jgi:hypothetical protein
MKQILRIARVIFIGICALLNFIYLTVSTLIVFDQVFYIMFRNKNAFTLMDFMRQLNSTQAHTVAASSDSLYMLPLYLVAVAVCFIIGVMFLYFMIEIPKVTALFYIDRLDRFLFIDRKQTVSFFIMLLLPVANFIFLKISAPGQVRLDFNKSMILCTISHTGIFLFVLFIKALKEDSYRPGDKGILLKFFSASVIRAGLFILTAVFMVLPYLLYYHFETDLNRVAAFHFFLVSALVSNYRFYRDNFTEIVQEME